MSASDRENLSQSSEPLDEAEDYRPCGCPWDYHLADCPILCPPIADDKLYLDERYWFF